MPVRSEKQLTVPAQELDYTTAEVLGKEMTKKQCPFKRILDRTN